MGYNTYGPTILRVIKDMVDLDFKLTGNPLSKPTHCDDF